MAILHWSIQDCNLFIHILQFRRILIICMYCSSTPVIWFTMGNNLDPLLKLAALTILRSDIWQELCHRQHVGNSDGITPVHHKELLHTCGCVFCYVMLCYIKVRVVCMLPSKRIQYFFRKSLSLYPKTRRITATISKHNKVKMILQQICKQKLNKQKKSEESNPVSTAGISKNHEIRRVLTEEVLLSLRKALFASYFH